MKTQDKDFHIWHTGSQEREIKLKNAIYMHRKKKTRKHTRLFCTYIYFVENIHTIKRIITE